MQSMFSYSFHQGRYHSDYIVLDHGNVVVDVLSVGGRVVHDVGDARFEDLDDIAYYPRFKLHLVVFSYLQPRDPFSSTNAVVNLILPLSASFIHANRTFALDPLTPSNTTS